MNLMAGLFAVVAAIVGTLIWAIITNVTGYQIGFMAIGVGALIGAGVRYGDGEGKPAAAFAGGLALAAIIFGNIMVIRIGMNELIKEESQVMLSEEMYRDELAMAAEFVQTPEASYPQFVAEQTNYTEATEAADVTSAELNAFMTEYAPELRRLHSEQTDYKTWRNQKYADMRGTLTSWNTLFTVLMESSGIIDVVFLLLGMAAAGRMVGEWD